MSKSGGLWLDGGIDTFCFWCHSERSEESVFLPSRCKAKTDSSLRSE
jgi:hypothetical protein